MPTRSEAEEHLRIIRSLMEKATIYRAISAPSALVGGVLAVTVAGLLIYLEGEGSFTLASVWQYFTAPWIGVLIVTGMANCYFLWRDARRRGETFVSAGMRLAIWALLPPILLAGVLTAYLCQAHRLQAPLAGIWVLCYGLALTGTANFAPRSIALLGWAFLLSGLALVVGVFEFPTELVSAPGRCANLIMGSTFGLFHLIYAACTWPRQATASDTGGKP